MCPKVCAERGGAGGGGAEVDGRRAALESTKADRYGYAEGAEQASDENTVGS